MRNWSVDENYLKKFPFKYKLWKLVQSLSYGLDGEKLKKTEVIKYWDKIKIQLDPARRDYLNFLLFHPVSTTDPIEAGFGMFATEPSLFKSLLKIKKGR